MEFQDFDCMRLCLVFSESFFQGSHMFDWCYWWKISLLSFMQVF
ncbi:hypothetical protein HanPI659440_Chr16g0629621 [Helianthus annuus]|nr:hypothetical protein HanPI659440_Chr16g0629621 [Helianthus annuus]